MKISEALEDGNFHDGGSPPLLGPGRSGKAVEEGGELTVNSWQLFLNWQLTMDNWQLWGQQKLSSCIRPLKYVGNGPYAVPLRGEYNLCGQPESPTDYVIPSEPQWVEESSQVAGFILCWFIIPSGGFLHSANATVGMTYGGGFWFLSVTVPSFRVRAADCRPYNTFVPKYRVFNVSTMVLCSKKCKRRCTLT